jgi:hypothetical protein
MALALVAKRSRAAAPVDLLSNLLLFCDPHRPCVGFCFAKPPGSQWEFIWQMKTRARRWMDQKFATRHGKGAEQLNEFAVSRCSVD